jgi:hypothetical protein
MSNFGIKKEKQGAKRFNSRHHIASGSTWIPNQKEDYSDDLILTQQKSTRALLLYVHPQVWNTLLQRAIHQKKQPRLIVCFNPVAGIEMWWDIRGMLPIEQGFTIYATSNPRVRLISNSPITIRKIE